MGRHGTRRGVDCLKSLFRAVKLNYSYTDSKTDAGLSDYYRNRIFFTGEYEF